MKTGEGSILNQYQSMLTENILGQWQIIGFSVATSSNELTECNLTEHVVTQPEHLLKEVAAQSANRNSIVKIMQTEYRPHLNNRQILPSSTRHPSQIVITEWASFQIHLTHGL